MHRSIYNMNSISGCPFSRNSSQFSLTKFDLLTLKLTNFLSITSSVISLNLSGLNSLIFIIVSFLNNEFGPAFSQDASITILVSFNSVKSRPDKFHVPIKTEINLQFVAGGCLNSNKIERIFFLLSKELLIFTFLSYFVISLR